MQQGNRGTLHGLSIAVTKIFGFKNPGFKPVLVKLGVMTKREKEKKKFTISLFADGLWQKINPCPCGTGDIHVIPAWASQDFPGDFPDPSARCDFIVKAD